MKDWLGSLGSSSKFDTLVKLALYSLFVFIAIIVINTADVKDNNNDKVEDNQPEINQSSTLIIPDNYNYKYIITLDDNIYSYQGSYALGVDTFKKNIDNKIVNYKFEDGKYYLLEKEKYIETSQEQVFDIVDYEYLDVKKIKYYFDNAKLDGNYYYVYLKDQITGNDTDKYIKMEVENGKIMMDYSKISDVYDSFIIVFEYEERIKGEDNETKEE